MPDQPDAIVVNDDDLVLHRPVAELGEPLRSVVVRWLTDHQVDPQRVALGSPVVRHEDSRSLSWREDRLDGRVVHHCYPAVPINDPWPAPFPQELREAPLRQPEEDRAGDHESDA